jgi:hypothetical protein
MIRRNTRDEKAMRLFELHFAQQEIKDWVQFRRTRLDQDNRVMLRKTAQIQDRCLEDRLFAEGFRSENVMALEVYPVAKTAWASGSVSPEEQSESLQIITELGLDDSYKARELFQEWLEKEPSSRLWSLWESFIRARSQWLPPSDFQDRCAGIYSACHKVAMASGGIWGIGRISPAEQRVLNKVKRVFELVKGVR